MSSALFLGRLNRLAQAYPPALRQEIAHRIRVDSSDIETDQWRNSLDALKEVSVLFSTWGMPVLDEEFLACAPNLRAVFYAAGTVKGFVRPETYRRGILVSSAWEANAIPVSEYTTAATLLSLKRFWSYSNMTGRDRIFRQACPVPGAYHSKVGIVSLGAIGRLVARRLGSFDLELLAHDPFVDASVAGDLGVQLVELTTIFSVCDVVTLHAPLLPQTENLIGGALIESMKEGATLINTSRGAIIDEAELCEVLARRPDLTAILDVTHPEPPAPDSPLYSLPNIWLTPHIAGSMDGEISRMGRWMTDEFMRYVDNLPLKHLVTPEMLERMA